MFKIILIFRDVIIFIVHIGQGVVELDFIIDFGCVVFIVLRVVVIIFTLFIARTESSRLQSVLLVQISVLLSLLSSLTLFSDLVLLHFHDRLSSLVEFLKVIFQTFSVIINVHFLLLLWLSVVNLLVKSQVLHIHITVDLKVLSQFFVVIVLLIHQFSTNKQLLFLCLFLPDLTDFLLLLVKNFHLQLSWRVHLIIILLILILALYFLLIKLFNFIILIFMELRLFFLYFSRTGLLSSNMLFL